MTRKEVEEIKERLRHAEKYEYNTDTHLTIGNYGVVEDMQRLIHALENDGIEDEPDENNEPELLPCPFCNAETSALEYEISDNHSYDDDKRYQGRVCCNITQGGCGAESGYCKSGDIETVKQRTADKWNTRTTTPTEPKSDDMINKQQVRPCDYVKHLPTGEEWVVCGVDYDKNEIIPCGYPFPTIAKISDCELIESRGLDQTSEMINALWTDGLQSFIEHKAKNP